MLCVSTLPHVTVTAISVFTIIHLFTLYFTDKTLPMNFYKWKYRQHFLKFRNISDYPLLFNHIFCYKILVNVLNSHSVIHTLTSL